MPYNSDSENTDNKNSSSDNPILINNNETNIEIKEKKYISVNYFILGDNEIDSEKIYCPDKPLFRISNSDKDIRLFSTGLKNYTFTFTQINDLNILNQLNPRTKEEIEFMINNNEKNKSTFKELIQTGIKKRPTKSDELFYY